MTSRNAFKYATLFALVLMMALVVAACGPTEGADTTDLTPGTLPETGEEITGTLPGVDITGTMTGTPEVMPTAEMMATDEMTATDDMTDTAGLGDEVTVELTAQDIQFDQNTITVPAGAQVTIDFTNLDPVGHNFAVYETMDAALAANQVGMDMMDSDTMAEGELFHGEIITDTATTYSFVAPAEPGTYVFVCDPHAAIMTGTLVVE